MSRIQAVILDLDGLMVDSEPLSYEAWKILLGEYGYELSEQDYKDLIGIDGNAAVNHLRKSKDLPLSNKEIIDWHYELWMEVAKEQASPMEGLGGFIDELERRGLKMGVASNSHAEYVHNILKVLGLDGNLRCVNAEDMVEHGKPAPDVYLATAECLDEVPEFCLAVEDSPTGLQAALNAGMRCVVVPNKALLEASFEGAFASFPTLVELTANLDWVLS